MWALSRTNREKAPHTPPRESEGSGDVLFIYCITPTLEGAIVGISTADAEARPPTLGFAELPAAFWRLTQSGLPPNLPSCSLAT